ncbi:MAG TPA: PAS domain-containing protein [Dongiaceae bacterium]|nr:PAS domain-containing protein [Dongiaceae bacterium]
MQIQPEGFAVFEDTSQARMNSTRSLFAYWRASHRDDMPPRRTEIDPAAIKPILPFILLGDIETDPFRVLFRLVGTAVADFSRHDFTGQYLDELGYSDRDSIEWADCYRYIHGQHVGVVGVNELHLTDGTHTSYEFAILPLLRGDDPAGSFIAIEAYEDLDHLAIPDLNPVTPRR